MAILSSKKNKVLIVNVVVICLLLCGQYYMHRLNTSDNFIKQDKEAVEKMKQDKEAVEKMKQDNEAVEKMKASNMELEKLVKKAENEIKILNQGIENVEEKFQEKLNQFFDFEDANGKKNRIEFNFDSKNFEYYHDGKKYANDAIVSINAETEKLEVRDRDYSNNSPINEKISGSSTKFTDAENDAISTKCSRAYTHKNLCKKLETAKKALPNDKLMNPKTPDEVKATNEIKELIKDIQELEQKLDEGNKQAALYDDQHLIYDITTKTYKYFSEKLIKEYEQLILETGRKDNNYWTHFAFENIKDSYVSVELKKDTPKEFITKIDAWMKEQKTMSHDAELILKWKQQKEQIAENKKLIKSKKSFIKYRAPEKKKEIQKIISAKEPKATNTKSAGYQDFMWIPIVLLVCFTAIFAVIYDGKKDKKLTLKSEDEDEVSDSKNILVPNAYLMV